MTADIVFIDFIKKGGTTMSIVNLIVDGRYLEAISWVMECITDMVDEYTAVFDTEEEVEDRILDGYYGVIVRDRYRSLLRWLEFLTTTR